MRNRRHRGGLSLSSLTALAVFVFLPPAHTVGDTITEEVTFKNGAVTLSGTLSLPVTGGPHPAVFLIGGSGPQDRNGAMRTIPGYRPFALIAEHLARNGFAVLHYDERGVGKSTGDYGTAAESDFIKDAETALEYLISRQDIADEQIGVLGHSEGAMIAAIVAGENPRVAFVILLGGGAVDGYSLLLRQVQREAEAAGMSNKAVAEAVEQQRRIFDLVLKKEWDRLRRTVEEITLSRLKALPDSHA